MATQEDIIKEQAEELKTLKKVVTTLLNRLNHLETRARSNDAIVRNNARDIRNVAMQNQSNTQAINSIAEVIRRGR